MLTPEKIAEMDKLTGLKTAPKPTSQNRLAELRGLADTAPKSALESVTGTLENFATGVAKGEVKTVQGLSRLGTKILNQVPGRVVNAVQGKGFVPTEEKGILDSEKADKALKPEGTAQKVGYGAEKLAEFFIPGGAIKNAELGLASKVANLPKAAQVVAKVAGGAIAEGVGAGTIAAAQTGSFKEGGKAALISALVSAPFKAVSALKKPVAGLLETSAEKSSSQALGATTKQNKQLSDKIVPELLKRRVVFGSRAGLLGKATTNADEVGGQIDDAFNALPDDTRVAVSPIMEKLEKAKSNFVIKGTNTVPEAAKAEYQAIQNIQKEIMDITSKGGDDALMSIDDIYQGLDDGKVPLNKVFANKPSSLGVTDESGVQSWVKKIKAGERPPITIQLQETASGLQPVVVDGTHRLEAYTRLGYKNIPVINPESIPLPTKNSATVSVESIRSFRQILDKTISKSKGGFGMTGSETARLAAQKEGANAIRNVLADELPDIAKLNKEYSFWKNVERVVGDTVSRTRSQGTPLGEIAAEAAGAVGGLTRGGTVGSALLTATGLRLLQKAVTSPAWRQASAVTKTALADAISSGATDKAVQILNKIVNAGAIQTLSQEETESPTKLEQLRQM